MERLQRIVERYELYQPRYLVPRGLKRGRG
jgi:hypothetical protein